MTRVMARSLLYLLPLLQLIAVNGQSSVWSDLPKCAQPCAEDATTAATNCDSTDYGCLCANGEFHQIFACCVRASCDTYDVEEVGSYSEGFCSVYGVTITDLPATACLSTYGAGPTGAAATATGTGGATEASATGASGGTSIEGTVTTTVSVEGTAIMTVTYTGGVAAATAAATATGATSPYSTSSSSSSSSNSGSSGDNGSSGSGSSSSTSSLGAVGSSSGGSSSLSTGAKIGIGVGAGVGGLLAICLIAFAIYKCATNGRSKQVAVGPAYKPVAPSSGEVDEKGVMYNDKTELDASQQLQQQQLQQQLQQQPERSVSPLQYHPSVSSHDGGAPSVSPVAPPSNGANELQALQQGYYQHPSGGAYELGGNVQSQTQTQNYSYQQQQQQHFGTSNTAQAEMPGNPQYPRYEMQ